jgi:hypothetical protein
VRASPPFAAPFRTLRFAALSFPRTCVGSSFTPFAMLSPETVNHIEYIKKRAGHLWRFL